MVKKFQIGFPFLTLLLSFSLALAQEKTVAQFSLGNQVGTMMFDFSAKDQHGNAQAFSTRHANKKTLLYFYSGCCGHCSEQLPKLLALHKRWADKSICYIGVEYFGDVASCSTRVKKEGLPGVILADSDGKICEKFGVGDFTLFLVDQNRVIQYRGSIDDLSSLDAALEKNSWLIVSAPSLWPPVKGQPYPDLTLLDQTGTPVKLSSFKGSVILLEPVGMNCPACQAFAGAHKKGSFQNIAPQADLGSIEEYLPRFGKGVSIQDSRLVYVQLLLYSMTMGAPTLEDAKAWAKHFGMDRSKNRVVLVGTPDMIGAASYNLIPGFQLIDKNFILRSDSTGHNAKDNLWETLLPMVPQLLTEK